MQNLIGLVGIAVLLGIAVLASSNRKAINLRIVGAAFATQAVVAVLVLLRDKYDYWRGWIAAIEQVI